MSSLERRADAVEVSCPEDNCEARPGEPCIYWLYGQDYPLSDFHPSRQERADERAWEAAQEPPC